MISRHQITCFSISINLIFFPLHLILQPGFSEYVLLSPKFSLFFPCHILLHPFNVMYVQVNASAQFCGVAEMIGPVDFEKSVDYWQQDKWSGQFPVKWHIIKDVPNNLFRHIILENNDNKPVTNSRDTQEVMFFLMLLKVFISSRDL